MTLPNLTSHREECKEQWQQQREQVMHDEEQQTPSPFLSSSNPPAPCSPIPVTIPFSLETCDDRQHMSISLSLLSSFDQEKQKLLYDFARVNERIMSSQTMTPSEIDRHMTSLTSLATQSFQQLLATYISRSTILANRDIAIVTRHGQKKKGVTKEVDTDMVYALEENIKDTKVKTEAISENEAEIDMDSNTSTSSHSTTHRSNPVKKRSQPHLDEDFRPSNPTGYVPKKNAGKSRRNLRPEVKQILVTWFDANFHDPYPNGAEKAILMEQTGLNHDQLCNWFINHRGRYWKPVLESARQQMEAETAHARSQRKSEKRKPKEKKKQQTKNTTATTMKKQIKVEQTKKSSANKSTLKTTTPTKTATYTSTYASTSTSTSTSTITSKTIPLKSQNCKKTVQSCPPIPEDPMEQDDIPLSRVMAATCNKPLTSTATSTPASTSTSTSTSTSAVPRQLRAIPRKTSRPVAVQCK